MKVKVGFFATLCKDGEETSRNCKESSGNYEETFGDSNGMGRHRSWCIKCRRAGEGNGLRVGEEPGNNKS